MTVRPSHTGCWWCIETSSRPGTSQWAETTVHKFQSVAQTDIWIFFFWLPETLNYLKKTKHNKKTKQATITSFFVFSQIYLHLVFISKTHDICIKLFCSFVPFLVFFSQRLNDSLSYTLIPGFWYFCVDGCWITWQLYWSAEEKRAECKSKAVQLPVDLRSCSH